MTRRAFLALTVGAGAAVLSGCQSARAATAVDGARADAPGRSVERLTVGGVERRYVRYAPPGLRAAAAVPLVLVLHGRGGSGAIAEWMYDMREQSDAHGFVVAYPDALGDPPTWHSGLGLGGGQQDDVDFIRALVEREAGSRPIDPNRTFVCGHSSGGMMSYRLAAEASDLFAAVGVVAGSAGIRLPNGRVLTGPKPDHPVSVIHVHGTDDRLVPYNGGNRRGPTGFLSVVDSIGLWVGQNGCDSAPMTETVGAARRETYAGGRDGSEVTLWTIEGGGHEWPQTRPALRPGASTVARAADVAATEQIWSFFATHPRGASSRTS